MLVRFKKAFIVSIFNASLLTALISLNAWSRPPDPENYIVINGGEADIPERAYVDGSSRSRAGGLQPDYYLDTHHGVFEPILKYANRLRDNSDFSTWDKIRLIQD